MADSTFMETRTQTDDGASDLQDDPYPDPDRPDVLRVPVVSARRTGMVALIDEADLPFVFDRFFRAETARNTPGTGLGLSIVAQAVDRHGGWVRASRSAQGGAEFTVQLPGATTLEALAERPPSVPSTLPARRP